MPESLYRTKAVKQLPFGAGAMVNGVSADTNPTGFASLQGVSTVAFVFPAQLDNRTITCVSSVPGDTGFTVAARTGRVNLDADQALALAAMPDIRLSANSGADSPGGIVYMMCMDG